MVRDDFTTECNIYGYMLKFRGRHLGGAGTIGKQKQHWRHRRANLKMYAEMAESEINAILNGCGQSRFLKIILGTPGSVL